MEDGAARVCAIIPAYNCGRYIAEALESVLSQTRPVNEVLVVDDGSTDDTRAVVERMGVRCITQSNQGPAQARNTGLRHTTAEFVALLDADDIWLPDKTEKQLAYLQQHPTALLVSGGKIWWDVESGTRSLFRYPARTADMLRKEIYFTNLIGNPSMTMIRRSAFARAGEFNTARRYGDDWEMWIRIVESGAVGFMPEPVMIYRWHQSNLSQSNEAVCRSTYIDIARTSVRRHLPPWKIPAAYLKIYKNFVFHPRYRQLISNMKQTASRLLAAPQGGAR